MRLQSRNLSGAMLFNSVDSLEVIEAYPHDKYLPSFLIRGEEIGGVFRAQIAIDLEGNNVRILTMYIPDRRKWDDDGRRRRLTL